MAFFRMMGRDSIEYHRRTVLGRDDDHAGAALAYYGTRGETPLVWGGALAGRLGLVGAVDDDTYDAIFGRGGAVDPVLDKRLVTTKRPGVELVVAAHKSVALLGVIGRADDMHAILDAESDATLQYLETWFERQGGRRGRAQDRVPTGGLLWARTRHATSRAGDPSPHDHVLIANLTEMLDASGGWKALDTAALRDVNHAATVAGRMAAAEVAVRLGYAIESDDGPSGRLSHWRIAGIPEAACEVLSKRSEEIDLHMESVGHRSYRARGVAARDTRAEKTDESPEALLPRWRDELTTAGWDPRRLGDRLRTVNERAALREPLTEGELADLATQLLSAHGELGNRRVFSRRDIVRVVGPRLYGLPHTELDRAVRAVIDHRETVPLVGQAGARERAWAAASVLAVEQAVAETSRILARADGPTVREEVVMAALLTKSGQVGGLTDGQVDSVRSICADGRGLDLIVGTAGAGKTTALEAVRLAYEAGGFRVLGAATSGQAARALGAEAGIEARTVASLLWRLNTGSLRLDARTVLLLDEAGMTDDRSMLAVLKAAQHAGTKVVVIGDHRQLCAVGLGGGLEALVGRHAEAVHVLDENVRQRDPGERHALDHLRSGDVGQAIDWYVASDRIVMEPDRVDALDRVVKRWLGDERAGASTLLLAWRRADVAALNALARAAWASEGHLTGPDIEAPGGRRFAVGDRVIALAPLAEGMMVTSERATVASVDDGGLVVANETGQLLRLAGEEIDGKHLDHAYAVTVHRAQGATVDRAHLLADGGGRELAYVGMSRARESTHVYVVADDIDEAVDDLRREWSVERRDRWILDVDAPAGTDGRRRPDLAKRVREGLRSARLRAEREAVLATLPPDRSAEVLAVHLEIGRLENRLVEARTGRGEFAGTAIGEVADRLADAKRQQRVATDVLRGGGLGRRDRRRWRREQVAATEAVHEREQHLDELIEPIEADLTRGVTTARNRLVALERDQSDRRLRGRLANVAERVRSIDRSIGVEHVREIESHGIEL